MASGSIQKRCKICRREGLSGRDRCSHREAVYYVCYRIGKKQKSEKIGTNKKDAERRLAEIISSLNNGTFFNPTDITFKDFAYKWLAEYARPRIKQRTHTSYESSIRGHLIPYLGDMHISDIAQEDIERVMSELLKTRKARTVNKTLKLLKTIMKYARRWKYIKESPVHDFDSFREVHEEMDFLKPDEIGLLIKHAREPYKTIFLTAILTGMRRGELLALQWGDVDWQSNTVFVRRSIYFDSKLKDGGTRWRFDSPKSRGSIRGIVMTPVLKKALEIHRLGAKYNEWDLIFTNTEGKPIDPDNMIDREFHPALVFAGLRRVRFHSLRHSYTALLISQGENIKFIQGQLGHASAQITLDRYGHLLPINSYAVGVKLDQQIFTDSDRLLPLEVP